LERLNDAAAFDHESVAGERDALKEPLKDLMGSSSDIMRDRFELAAIGTGWVADGTGAS
jgi:hypothetical protein